MDVREKLIEILRKPIFPHEVADPTEAVADYLLDSGVTVQECGQWIDGDPYCPICKKDKFRGLDADVWADWKPDYCPNCGAKMDLKEA